MHLTFVFISFNCQTIRKFETSRARLEAQAVQLNRQLQKEIRDNATLTQEGLVHLCPVSFGPDRESQRQG